MSSRTWASGLLAIRPSRTAAFSADRSVARTRSTVEAATGVPLRVRWRERPGANCCPGSPPRRVRTAQASCRPSWPATSRGGRAPRGPHRTRHMRSTRKPTSNASLSRQLGGPALRWRPEAAALSMLWCRSRRWPIVTGRAAREGISAVADLHLPVVRRMRRRGRMVALPRAMSCPDRPVCFR